MPLSEKKIIPQTSEQKEISIYSVEILFVSQNGKCSKFRSEPSLGNKKANQLAEEKNTRNFVILLRTVPRKIKMHGIPFAEEKNTRNFFFETFSEIKKLLVTCSITIKDKEKHSWLLKTFFTEICSVLNLGIGYSKTHGIPWKKHFFHGIRKTVPSLFLRIFLNGILIAFLIWRCF